VKAAVYIPNFNGAAWLPRTLQSLRGQTARPDVVVVDNGSTDGSADAVRADFPEVTLLELGENIGFGPALNRAVATHPAEAIVLLNSDVECEPGFCAALLAGLEDGAEMVAGVLLQEREPELIDSAGIVADHTLMGFDHLHGEPVAAVTGAPDPLGPTGGAALYRRAAWEAVGGFDERIFLYYEDLDLALRIAAGGGRCRLAPGARALHAYSASLGAASGAKYARTGWSRGYMLRRYGVMRDPALALRALACEAAIAGGQLLRDRTAAGLSGRLRGFRAGADLPRREVGAAPLLGISARGALALRRARRGDD
jgi:N-acetylglucosaminyl-diphospho-decaprenol L-rhamnosyltransferase